MPMKKKVLFFIESFSGGGAERVLLTILRNLDRRKYAVTVIVMCDSGVYSKDFHSLDIRIVNVLRHKSALINRIKYKLLYSILPPAIACKYIMKGVEADTYVAFVEGYCTKILSYIKTSKRKIAWVHCDLEMSPWPIEKKIFKSLKEETTAYKQFDLVIGVSRQVSDIMQHRYGVSNSSTIYNPIDEYRIVSQANTSPRQDVSKDHFNVVSVGRLNLLKGYDILIGLLPQIITEIPNIKLYIIGEGEEWNSLTQQIKDLGLQNHVVLTGFIQNPYSLMKQMDVFVCSSIAEGYSLALAEAMLVGLPIISMDCAGPRELLDDGKYGFLTNSFDEFRDSIIRIANDKELLRTMKERSKERGKLFDTESIIHRIEEIL